MLGGGLAAQAQVGAGSLTFNIDNVTAMNGYSDGGTGASVTLGTQLTGGVGVTGVTGNGGTTTVKCYANGSQIFSWSTSVNAHNTFPWSPSSTGTYTLYCSGTWSGIHVNGTVQTPNIVVPVTYIPVSGYINPKYIILGIDYVTPGATSYTEYCNNTTVSSTNKISNTFTSSYQQGVSVKLTESFIGGYLSGSSTQSQSTTYTESTNTSNAVTVATSTTNCEQINGATNSYEPNNHDYDIIWLWLNPVALLTFQETPGGTIVATQWNGWGFNAKDQPTMDVFPAYVGCLNGDLSGCNLTELSRTWDNDEKWPSGQGPALTSTDKAAILAMDPFSGCEPSTPLTQECSVSPSASRFTIADPSNIQYLQPPVGAGQITTIYTLNYTVSDQQSRSYTLTNATTFGVESVFTASAFGNAVAITTNSSQTFTSIIETDQSLTTSNSQTTTASITGPPCNVSGNECVPAYPSVGDPGPTEFDVYEDTLYGTFLYYPSDWLN
jgi:hypothetical protein